MSVIPNQTNLTTSANHIDKLSKKPTYKAESTTSNAFSDMLKIQSENINKTLKDTSSHTIYDKIPDNEKNNIAETEKIELHKWKSEYIKRGISEERRQEVEKYTSEFEKIIYKATAQNGYENPQKFILSLSDQELEVLQHLKGLAFTIKPESLNKEGAFNLLKSPRNTKDLDHDGFEMIGIAKTWHFPPDNAPKKVHESWHKTTSNLSDRDKMLLESSFLPIVIESVHGTIGTAYIDDDSNYLAIVKKAIEATIASRPYNTTTIQRENLEKRLDGLNQFLNQLQNY
ncbi:MAG: hypothetical protein R3D71_07235 [Rickettsiales bacterium]